MNWPVMNWLFDTLRSEPEIAIFFALAVGLYVGSLKFGKYSLGNVTGVLLIRGFNRRAEIVRRLTNATSPAAAVHTFTIEAKL